MQSLFDSLMKKKGFIFDDSIVVDETVEHLGTKFHSGRYPWGSGNSPYQRSGDFISKIDELKKAGWKESEIAKFMSCTTTQLRVYERVAKHERREEQARRAQSLRDDGLSLNQIASKMGFKNDSSVRALLDQGVRERRDVYRQTADFIKARVDEVGMVDVGKGIELELGLPRDRVEQALFMLEMEGYSKLGARVEQATNPGKHTTLQVLAPPGTQHKEIYNFGEIHSLRDYTSHDDGVTFTKLEYPKSLSSDRVYIRYDEQGGTASDGLIEVRRGVPDVSLGESHYAQVRILVDDSHYMKGMAIYSDNIPDGYDMVFNTNKPDGTPSEKVFKPITNDPDNPFGSYIKANGQSYYTDADGNRQLSVINKRSDEGDWSTYTKTLPSQFLAKQNLPLIKRQIDLSVYERQAELNDILALTNPTVRKKMLQSFADGCDSDAVDLAATALPRQQYQVLLPLTKIRDTEVFAPNYNNGEQVALVRFPHADTSEIPILTVNNKNANGRNLIGMDALDAVGISKNVADRMSGADFDGDFVIVIPTNNGKTNIKSTKPFAELEGFDPRASYPQVEGMRLMKSANGKDNTGNEMGRISNLITDMQILGASNEELARAMRHSMVVIDAAKHKLNYKLSEKENGIAELRDKYQGYTDPVTGERHGGASTLLSRTTGQTSVPRYKGMPNIDPATGRVSYTEAFTPSQRPKTLDTKYNPKTGQEEPRMRKSQQGAETDDAYTLSSGSPKEALYADYSNSLKALANRARMEMVNTQEIPYSPSAAKAYAPQVESLTQQYITARLNAPRERAAQVAAAAEITAKRQSNPNMTTSEVKKLKQTSLERARASVGAQRTPIKISDAEWTAIQAGAISHTKLTDMFKYVDDASLRSHATPHANLKMTNSKQTRLSNMAASGNYTIAEMARALGVSTTTVSNYL